jgi:hypothetical protein
MTALALDLVILLGLGGQPVAVAPEHVISLRTPHGGYHEGVRCVVHTDDGHHIPLAETCLHARHQLMRS